MGFRLEPSRPPRARSSGVAIVRREVVLASLDALLASEEYQAPRAIAAVVSSLGRTEIAPEVMIEQIDADPEVRDLVVKLAASPAYLSTVSARNIVDTAHWLGTRTVWDLYLEAALARALFQKLGGDAVLGSIQRHAVAVGHLCRLISRRVAGPSESAFAMGVLHDVGLAFAYLALMKIQTAPVRLDPQAIWPELLGISADATAKVCKAWRIPPDISIPLLWHHRAAPIRDRELAVLFLADEMARDLGRGHPTVQSGEHRLDARGRARAVLGIPPNQVAAIRFEADRLLDKMG